MRRNINIIVYCDERNSCRSPMEKLQIFDKVPEQTNQIQNGFHCFFQRITTMTLKSGEYRVTLRDIIVHFMAHHQSYFQAAKRICWHWPQPTVGSSICFSQVRTVTFPSSNLQLVWTNVQNVLPLCHRPLNCNGQMTIIE